MFPRRSSRRSGSSCSRASPPTRPSNASWPPSTCCWSPTTSSSCSPPRRSSADCSRPVPRSRSSPPAASRSLCRPRSATRCRRSLCPSPDTPEDPQALAETDAVALFCERARAHDPGFDLGDANAAAVAEICRRVDGLPLAIELAAARCGLLSPTEIAERLDTALGAPGAGARDAPARQQTLRATIDWSHELLSDAEKRCFARFAVFAGGATVEAAETITAGGLDTLDGLVTKSLLVATPARVRAHPAGDARDDPRLRRASASPPPPTSRPCASTTIATTSRSPERHGTERALRVPARREHLARLDAEIDNLHAALGWAVAQPERRTGARDGGSARLLLAHAKPLRRRRDWIDQALTCRRRRPSGPARPRSAHEGCLWQMGRGAEQPAVLAGARRSPAAWRSRDPLPSAPEPRRSRDRRRAARCRRPRRRGAPLGHAAGRVGDRRSVRLKAFRRPPPRSARARRHGRLATRRRQRPPSREPAHLRGLRRAVSAVSSTQRLCRPRDSDRARAGQSVRMDDQQRQSWPGRAAHRRHRYRFARVPRGTHALPRGRPPPSRSKDSVALPPSPWCTATTSAPRDSSAPRRTPLRTHRGSGRGQARRAFSSPPAHGTGPTPECRGPRRPRAELRGRDRLRPRRTAGEDSREPLTARSCPAVRFARRA